MPLGHPELLADRPVNAVAFAPAAAGEPLLLAAYGPVGAQLGGAELLKVRERKHGGEGEVTSVGGDCDTARAES